MRKFIVLVLSVVMSHMAYGQITHIKHDIDKIIKNKEVKLGFALYDFANGETLSIHGNERFPMQSVFKFPIALAVLNEVDHGRMALDQDVLIEPSDLLPDLWSPIREKYPQGNVRLPLSEIVKYTVAQSDNVGCDLLLRMLNGPLTVEAYMHSKGIADISIKNNEQEIQSSWNIQFDNWTTPQAMIQLLKLLHNKALLQPETHSFLWSTLSATSTGSTRKKLPKGAVVAHKTGTSGYNKENVSAATNDVGIIVLPSGKQVAYTIFVTDAREPAGVVAEIIADIVAAIYYSESIPKSN